MHSIPKYFNRLVFFFSCGLFVASLVSARAPVTVHLFDDSGQEISSSLTIGSTLHVGLEGAPPWRPYRIVLRDESGLQIAATEARADGQGALEPLGMFYDSGVTPCTPPGIDPVAPKTPPEYQYSNLSEANKALVGRPLRVEIIDLGQNVVVQSRQLIMIVDPYPYVYFSDRGACLRRDFVAGENIYLSAVNASPGTLFRVFVLEAPRKSEWEEDEYDFDEAREWQPCLDASSYCPKHPEGTLLEVDGPLTTRLVPGPFPSNRGLIALARIAVDEGDTLRLQCDRATQRSMVFDREGEPGDGHSSSWTCPPCPPDN